MTVARVMTVVGSMENRVPYVGVNKALAPALSEGDRICSPFPAHRLISLKRLINMILLLIFNNGKYCTI